MKQIWPKILSASFIIVYALSVYAKDYLHFGTEATYSPFVFMEENGKITGFETELVTLLCEDLKVKCQFSHSPFDALIPSLKVGKYDGVYGGFDITETRKKQLLFSEPIYKNSSSFISKIELPVNDKNALNKIVGVQQGSSYQIYLQKKYQSKITLNAYGSIQDAFLDLKAGRIQAVYGDTDVLKEWHKKGPEKTFLSTLDEKEQVSFFGSGYGIAMDFKNKELIKKFNKGLVNIQKNGKFKMLHKKYWPKRVIK